MPVIFHNLRGYDGHFIIKEASKYTSRIDVIAQSFEKYMTFKFLGLRFIDSFLFMSESLEKLAKNLNIEDMKYSVNYWGDKVDLLRKKGHYPYEYVKNAEVFNEKTLPAIDSFYSQIALKGISEDDYAHAEKVWNDMKCLNFGDYHDIYLKTDVLLFLRCIRELPKNDKKHIQFRSNKL